MIAEAWGHADTLLPAGMTPPAEWSDAPLGGLGGGGQFTPDPPWYERTRQRVSAASAEDEASNRNVIIDDGWKDWVTQIRPAMFDGYVCGIDGYGKKDLPAGVLDVLGVDYATLEDDVHRIMSRGWIEGDPEQWDEMPDLPLPVIEEEGLPDFEPAEDVVVE